MIETMPTADVVDAERFERIGVAAMPETVGPIRDEFAGWLARFFDLGAERASDLVLAVYEALANSAEFAYAGGAGDPVGPGTMDLSVWYDVADRSITAVVSDRGVWRMSDGREITRGRGISLMRALSDRASIESSVDGTTVKMVWRRISRR